MAKQLDRQHGFWAVYSMAVAAMLGTGVFVLPAVGAVSAGPYLWLSYLIAGLVVVPAVLTKAELATAMPVSGGAYVYVDRAMGPWMGTVAGLGTWFSLSAKTALGFVGLGAYLVAFSELPAIGLSILCLLALAWLNLRGMGKISDVQKLVVLIAFSTLAVFATLGIQSPHFDPAPAPSSEAFGGILTGAALMFAAYAGVTKVCSIAEEVQHPRRNLPLGMLAAQFSVMLVYSLVAWALGGHAMAPTSAAPGLSEATPLATAGPFFFDDAGIQTLAVVAVVSLVASCNAGVLSLSRFPFAMAKDKLLPHPLTRVDAHYRTPRLSIFLSAAVVLALLFVPLMTLAILASGFKIFIFCLNHVALILLRETGARWYRPSFRSPLYPWVQILGIACSLVLLFFLGTLAALAVVGGVSLATAWYVAFGRTRVTRTSAFQHLWGEAKILRNTENAELEEAMTDQAPRVIVPVFSDQEDAGQLVRLGASFVELGVLEVLRLEEVPEQLHLMDKIEQNPSQSSLEKEAEKACHDLQIALDFNEVITHNAKQALLQHAQATHAHWLVMSWPEENKHMRLVRNPMAWWLDHPPCDLAVFKDRGERSYKRILVLAEPGPYDSLVTHVADRIAQQENGELLLYRVLPEEASPLDLEAHGAYHDQLGELLKSPFTSLIERSSNPIQSIADRSEGFDLLILGAHPEQALKTLLLGSFEHRVAARVHCSVLRLKTPRDLVHPRLEYTMMDLSNRFELKPALEHASLQVNSSSATKEDLFKEMASQLQESTGHDADEILAALWQRERFQSTALTGNLALMAANHPALQTTRIGVVTSTLPVDFRGPGQREVDCFFVVIAPPKDRQHQLWLLTQIARMTLRSDFLPQVREAATPEELRATLVRVAGNGLL